MLSPSPGSTFSSSTVNFGWTAGNANGYGLYIGNSVGSKDIYFSGLLSTLSVIVSNLPALGRTIYVRLWSRIGTTGYYNDYTYKAFGLAKGIISKPIFAR